MLVHGGLGQPRAWGVAERIIVLGSALPDLSRRREAQPPKWSALPTSTSAGCLDARKAVGWFGVLSHPNRETITDA
jgi:hypothetical protein